MKKIWYVGVACASLLVLNSCASGTASDSAAIRPEASTMRKGGTGTDGAATKSRIVKGKVLQIEGSAYVIREREGAELRLPVDQDTRMEHTPKVGDQIIAQVAEDGRTRSIRSASAGMP